MEKVYATRFGVYDEPTYSQEIIIISDNPNTAFERLNLINRMRYMYTRGFMRIDNICKR